MKYRLMLAAAASLLPLSSSAEEIRYEWDPVPNAVYYRGKVQRPSGDVANFRTPETWLLFEEGSVVTLESFGSDDEPIGPVKLRGVSPETPPAIPAPEPEPAPLPEPEPTPVPEAAPEAPTPEDAQEEPAPSEAIVRNGPRDLGHVTLHLGIGKEWIDAAGGISEYKGSTNIGGTILDAESQGPNSPWIFAAEFSAHNFSTVTKEQSSTGGVAAESESKFLRLSVRASAFYDFDVANPNYRVAAGLGLAYFRMPMLIVEDDVTGAAELTTKTAMGPFLGISYLRYLSAVHSLGATFEYLPMTLSKDVKGNGTKLLLSWQYSFVKSLYANVGLKSERVALTTDVDCPNVTGCEESSSSSSNLLSALMGIGYRW